MSEFFCVHCGIRTKDNATKTPDYFIRLTCDTCGMRIKFSIEQVPTKTDEEIEAAFQNTPLTDSQRGTKKRFSSQVRKS